MAKKKQLETQDYDPEPVTIESGGDLEDGSVLDVRVPLEGERDPERAGMSCTATAVTKTR